MADMFRLSRTAFPRLGGGNSAGKPVPADPGAPVAAVLTDDDDGDQRQVHGGDTRRFRFILSK